MGSSERSKMRLQLWGNPRAHFLLCFVLGFFTGFAPIGHPSRLSSQESMSLSSSLLPEPVKVILQAKEQNFNGSFPAAPEKDEETVSDEEQEETGESTQTRLVIIITPTSKSNKLQRGVLLRRLANTLKLVTQPLLWIVVEHKTDDSQSPEILRKTGIMYRHIISKDNFSNAEAETDHQRNLALFHIEHHRLSGIVLFAGLSNVYDLSLFHHIRAVEAFGAWPVAKLSANRFKVTIEGPTCDPSDVIGWHSKQARNGTYAVSPAPVHISGFAFNSSVLWDPERWGRTSTLQENSQNSLEFVKKVVTEEETRVKGIPVDACSKVMLWESHIF